MKNKFNTMFRRFAALASAAVMLTAAEQAVPVKISHYSGTDR